MKFVSACLLLAASLLAKPVWASHTDTVRVHSLHFMENGVVIFYHSGPVRTGAPACGGNQASRFAINAATDAGKAQLAGLMTAYAAGRSVRVFGANHCNAYGDTESVSYFHTVD